MNAIKKTKPEDEHAAYVSDEQRWAAVQARDARADGHFVCGVRTTGVYCRPSSSARLPRRENVEFFDTERAARAAGYRASQRASGDQTAIAAQRAAMVAKACRLIEGSETPPNLDDLAEEVGMSPFHFCRVFRALVGLPPHRYLRRVRLERSAARLEAGDGVTDTCHAVGFNNLSHFIRTFRRVLGVPPSRFRA